MAEDDGMKNQIARWWLRHTLSVWGLSDRLEVVLAWCDDRAAAEVYL